MPPGFVYHVEGASDQLPEENEGNPTTYFLSIFCVTCPLIREDQAVRSIGEGFPGVVLFFEILKDGEDL